MRRKILAGALVTLFAVAACGAPEGPATQEQAGPIPDKPESPVELNILDVAGNLQLTKGMIQEFVEKNPDIISDVTFSEAPSPDLVGKIKAQQNAGRVDIGMVLTGNDGLSAGLEQGLWEPILPKHANRLPGTENYLEPAAAMQELSQGQGVVVTYYPSGPLIEYMPNRVPNPPKTAQQLFEYAKANPGKVEYARPANSGPGRTFLMGLPYILGDSDPKDPQNGWSKTWAYLKELDKYIERYPSGTTPTMQDLANGTANIILTTTGWDINPRAQGTVPKAAEVGTLEGFTWVTDAHYAVIPKGATADQQSAVLNLIQFMLTKKQQAKAYDEGYFYPGPAVEGVDISMAPKESQQVIAEYGRPKYERLIADNPKTTPLDTKAMVAAFDRWDREVGGNKVEEE